MTDLSLEIERKYRVADLNALRERILAAGGLFQRSEVQSDHYFMHPIRDFAVTDEVLRIRCLDARTQLTYKGPRQERLTKIREEIEVELAADPIAVAKVSTLLQRLGFRQSLIVQKKRDVFQLPLEHEPITVCLDQVDRLGSFAEIEVIATAVDVAAAKKMIAEVQALLNLSQPIEDSYLKMLIAKSPL